MNIPACERSSFRGARLVWMALALAVALASVPVAGTAQDMRVVPEWSSLETQHFVIHFEEKKDRNRAENLAPRAEFCYKEVADYLGFQSSDKIQMRIYGSSRDFRESAGRMGRRGLLGTYETYGDSGFIRVDASNTFEQDTKIIKHELTHALIWEATKKRANPVPLWFNEGLAVFVAQRYSPEMDGMVYRAAARGELIPFSQLEHRFPSDTTKMSLAYAQSFTLVKRLTWFGGEGVPARVVGDVRSGSLFGDAIKKQTEMTTPELFVWWKEDVSKRNLWQRVLEVAPEASFAALGLIAGFVAISLWWRRQRAIHRYSRDPEWEEYEDDDWY